MSMNDIFLIRIGTHKQEPSRTGGKDSKRLEMPPSWPRYLRNAKTSLVTHGRRVRVVYFDEIINRNIKHTHFAAKIRSAWQTHQVRTPESRPNTAQRRTSAGTHGATRSLMWNSPISLGQRFSHFLGSGQILSVTLLKVTG